MPVIRVGGHVTLSQRPSRRRLLEEILGNNSFLLKKKKKRQMEGKIVPLPLLDFAGSTYEAVAICD